MFIGQIGTLNLPLTILQALRLVYIPTPDASGRNWRLYTTPIGAVTPRDNIIFGAIQPDDIFHVFIIGRVLALDQKCPLCHRLLPLI